jgi:hypothetical protein
MGVAELGCPNLFVFLDESAPTFQQVVIDLSAGPVVFSLFFFSVRSYYAFGGSVDGERSLQLLARLRSYRSAPRGCRWVIVVAPTSHGRPCL